MSIFKERLRASLRDIQTTASIFDSIKQRLVNYLTEISNARLVAQAVFNKQAHLIEFEEREGEVQIDDPVKREGEQRLNRVRMYENEILVGELMYKIHTILEKLRTEYITALLQRLLKELESSEKRLNLMHREPSDVLEWTKNKVRSLMTDIKQIVDICQKSAKYIMGPLEKLDNDQCYNAILQVKQRTLELESLASFTTKLTDE